MREWTETHREGTDVGPVDWEHPSAKDMPAIWREAEKTPEAFSYCENGGLYAKTILRICMYDGWPYWEPRPAIQYIGPLGTPEWAWFTSYGVSPSSIFPRRVSPSESKDMEKL